jgi:hypothetical protein
MRLKCAPVLARVLAPVLAIAALLTVPLAAEAAPPRVVKASTPLYKFTYSYPAAAASQLLVRAILDRDLIHTRATIMRDAARDRIEAQRNHFPFHPYESQTEWKVVTDLPGWLSLSGQVYAYTGGAHGNTGFQTLLWDKRAHMRREPVSLFPSPAAFAAAVKAPFCAALEVERKKKRGTTWTNDIPEFDQCIDPVKDATVILGSGDGQHFTRIGFLIDPYAAGPYAEGSYEVTVPVTPALLQAVKPAFRAAFAPGPAR